MTSLNENPGRVTAASTVCRQFRRRLNGFQLAVICILWGCTSTADVTSDLGREDAAMDDRARGSERCAANEDCDDGLFCNGAEQCDPSEPSADSHGCLGGRSPCMSTQTCNEAMDRCVSVCDRTPDADHDGHDARECGGDDCDDGDATRFPGAGREVCDPAQREHDEDCDPTTFANGLTRDGDRDMDGYVDARCCNEDRNGMRYCGRDCDDMNRDVHPDLSEACNGRDDNCNGMIDEGLTSREYCRDADGDGVGRRASGAMMACTPPAGYVLGCDDCDDANRGRNPGAPEVCDSVDNDCDGVVDEGLPVNNCALDEDRDGFTGPAAMSSCRPCAPPWFPVTSQRDCCDRDSRVFPAVRCVEFFGARNACGSFDYNCDGSAQATYVRSWPSTRFPCGPDADYMTTDWMNGAPSCGQMGDRCSEGVEVSPGYCRCTVTSRQLQRCC